MGRMSFGCIRLGKACFSGQSPLLNLAGHCDPMSGTCTQFGSEISYCQSRGIKVLLSLGGAIGSYTLSSANDAKQVADYLYQTYLGGGSGGGPLGNAVLDGIDFDIEYPGSTKYWDVLATALSQYTTPSGGNFYLSASPQCSIPDPNLDAALKTGLFNYVWVKFYNNPSCDIRAGVYGLLGVWNNWSSYLSTNSPNSELFMGLPASSDAATGGYIDPNVLIPEILPPIKNTPNYGGLMLWSRSYDIKNSYSLHVVVPACSGLNDQIHQVV